jgi:hypothetical protein
MSHMNYFIIIVQKIVNNLLFVGDHNPAKTIIYEFDLLPIKKKKIMENFQ